MTWPMLVARGDEGRSARSPLIPYPYWSCMACISYGPGEQSGAVARMLTGCTPHSQAKFSFRHPRTPDRRTHRCKFNTAHSHIKRIRQLFHGPDLRAQPLTPPPALRPAPRRSRSNTTRNSTLAPTVLGYSLPGATQLSQTTLHQIALHRAQSRSLEVHTKSNR